MAGTVKITTLIENMPDQDGVLDFEHGFSALVEYDDKKILFDTGQSGAFVKNAKAMNMDLSDIDGVILSHGHYDHTGGVPMLLSQLKKKTSFYIGEEFFTPKFKLLEDGSYKYNGNPFEQELLTETGTLAEVQWITKDVTWLSEKLVLFKNFARVTKYEEVNPKFFVKTKDGFQQDYFPDEIALGLMTGDGLVLIVSCSHVGIVNIMEHIKRTLNRPVTVVLGGTHLVEADEERLIKTVEALKDHGVKTVAVSHCTGETGMELLKKEFKSGFVMNNTGKVMEL